MEPFNVKNFTVHRDGRIIIPHTHQLKTVDGRPLKNPHYSKRKDGYNVVCRCGVQVSERSNRGGIINHCSDLERWTEDGKYFKDRRTGYDIVVVKAAE